MDRRFAAATAAALPPPRQFGNDFCSSATTEITEAAASRLARNLINRTFNLDQMITASQVRLVVLNNQ
ncbi:MAG: hypothetical protein M3Q31_26520 [Actinomycetota bacterium]|nr:hypothetical protein [Actinomycetota bacterium]